MTVTSTPKNNVNHNLTNNNATGRQRSKIGSILHSHPALINSISGAATGLVVSVTLSPFDVIKTRLTVQRSHVDMDPQHKQFHGFFSLYNT